MSEQRGLPSIMTSYFSRAVTNPRTKENGLDFESIELAQRVPRLHGHISAISAWSLATRVGFRKSAVHPDTCKAIKYFLKESRKDRVLAIVNVALLGDGTKVLQRQLP